MTSQNPPDGPDDWSSPLPEQPPPYGPPGGQAPPPPQPQPQPPQTGPFPPHQPGLPPYGVGQPPRLDNFLVPAILSTLCCFLPTGIVAIIFAVQVNSKLAAGDVAGATSAAAKARMWTFISVGVGLAVGVLYVIAVAASTESTV